MENKLVDILNSYKNGDLNIDQAISEFKNASVLGLIGEINLDEHREIRQGFPEVIFGENKNITQLEEIISHYIKNNKRLLVTRLQEEKWNKLKDKFTSCIYNDKASCLTNNKPQIIEKDDNFVLIMSAGTSDIAVVEEAKETLEMMGEYCKVINDVGVAGIHRLFSKLEIINKALVLIVIAGMDGALPSVIGGLTDKPIIAVPTSIGYGTSFNGVAPLLTMLNSCAPGVSVVNINNGFGAAFCAKQIIKIACK